MRSLKVLEEKVSFAELLTCLNRENPPASLSVACDYLIAANNECGGAAVLAALVRKSLRAILVFISSTVAKVPGITGFYLGSLIAGQTN